MSDGTTITEEHLHEERHTVETILGGALGGGIIAIAGAILAIIGLAGMESRWLLGRCHDRRGGFLPHRRGGHCFSVERSAPRNDGREGPDE